MIHLHEEFKTLLKSDILIPYMLQEYFPFFVYLRYLGKKYGSLHGRFVGYALVRHPPKVGIHGKCSLTCYSLDPKSKSLKTFFYLISILIKDSLLLARFLNKKKLPTGYQNLQNF
jgi:hypothetical protein